MAGGSSEVELGEESQALDALYRVDSDRERWDTWLPNGIGKNSQFGRRQWVQVKARPLETGQSVLYCTGLVSIYPIIIAYIQNMNSMKMCVLELSEIRDRKAQEERWSSLPFWKQIEQCPRKSQD